MRGDIKRHKKNIRKRTDIGKVELLESSTREHSICGGENLRRIERSVESRPVPKWTAQIYLRFTASRVEVNV